MSINYAYTILYVQNVSETLAFYKTAFGFEQKFITPEKDYGELVSGQTTIAFASLELANSNLKEGYLASTPTQKPFGIELAFTSDQVVELMAKAVAAGAIKVADVVTKPWGQQVGYVRDINGFLIELCSPIG